MKKTPNIQSGEKHNFLTFTGSFEVRPKSHVYAECKCDCGSIIYKRFFEVISNKIKSCGAKQCRELSQKIEIREGDRYGRLSLTGRDEMRINSVLLPKRYVEAACECGVTKYYMLSTLRSGSTKSCGCYHKDKIAESNITHGGTVGRNFHPTYFTWCGMKQRCYNIDCKHYSSYGGRGISICDEWVDDYVAFYNWSLLNNWQRGLTLDRKNNDLNYAPSNCRWTTSSVQNRNKRNNVNITAFNETKCATDWQSDYRSVVNRVTISQRIKKGWLPEDAISLPFVKHEDRMIAKKFITAFGETKALVDWAKDDRCTVGVSGLRGRINKGMAGDDVVTLNPIKSNQYLTSKSNAVAL